MKRILTIILFIALLFYMSIALNYRSLGNGILEVKTGVSSFQKDDSGNTLKLNINFQWKKPLIKQVNTYLKTSFNDYPCLNLKDSFIICQYADENMNTIDTTSVFNNKFQVLIKPTITYKNKTYRLLSGKGVLVFSGISKDKLTNIKVNYYHGNIEEKNIIVSSYPLSADLNNADKNMYFTSAEYKKSLVDVIAYTYNTKIMIMVLLSLFIVAPVVDSLIANYILNKEYSDFIIMGLTIIIVTLIMVLVGSLAFGNAKVGFLEKSLASIVLFIDLVVFLVILFYLPSIIKNFRLSNIRLRTAISLGSFALYSIIFLLMVM